MSKLFTSTIYSFGLVLYYLRLDWIVIWLGRNNVKVLLYHDCSDAESAYTAGLDCTITPAVFAQHLDYVAKHYTVISIDDLERGGNPLRSVAISFDDGYRSVYDHAFPALRQRNMCATVYLVTNVVDNIELVWVNELNYYLRTHSVVARPIAARYLGVSAELLPEQLISMMKDSYDRRVITAVLTEISDAIKIDRRQLSQTARLYVDWAQVDEMQRSNITFGNHTMTHPNLAKLTGAEQTAEVAGAQAVLTSRLGRKMSFAYPFGNHNVETAEIAFGIGVTSLAEVGGSNYPGRGRNIGRVHVVATTSAGLFAQMEVVEPLKAYLRSLRSLSAGLQAVQTAEAVASH